MKTSRHNEDILRSSPGPHWSKDRKSFGFNIPGSLKDDDLGDVQADLAAVGLDVKRGDTPVIIPQEDMCGIPTGSVVGFPNGDIQVHAPRTQRRSSDGGRTWRKVTSSFFGYECRLSDGQIVQFGRRDGHHAEAMPPTEAVPPAGRSRQEGFVKEFGWLICSRDNGVTEQKHLVPIHVPKKLEMHAMSHARIVELPDGNLLAADYGTFEDDPVVGFNTWVTKWGEVKRCRLARARVFVLRSSDRGRTWHYLSSVAFDLSRDNRKTIGGFTESDLMVLPGGRLLCFMRTVGGGGIRPLRMSTSSDGGRTWSTAVSVADRGVCPYGCRMGNGILVVIYGHPGNWLMFSVDEGRTWIGHFQFYMGPKAWDAWNYCAVQEVAPDTLLAVYDRTDPNNRMTGDIVGTFFEVKKQNKALDK